MSAKPAIILASSSKPRKRLLERLQIPFTCISPHADETPFENEAPEELVIRLARAKAIKVGEHHKNALVIGCDQVALINNEITGKPHTYEAAFKQLQAASGKVCHFINGLALYNSETGHIQSKIIIFDVKFKHLTPEMIDNYLSREDALECAGSIKSEGLAIALFERMMGTDTTSLEGLPLISLVEMLNSENYAVI